MVRLLLIRHGETTLGAQRRYAGHGDAPLTEDGWRQVRALRPRLARGPRIDAVFSSDLGRCRQTAELLFPAEHVVYTELLRELDFGAWEGRTPDECARLAPARFARWCEDPLVTAPPAGETLAALTLRVLRFLERVEGSARSAALVTHAGPIRVILGRAGLPHDHPVPPGSLHVIEHPYAAADGRAADGAP